MLKKLDVIYLTHKNRLIWILYCWLLKKTLVMTTSLTNPESAPGSMAKALLLNCVPVLYAKRFYARKQYIMK